MEDKAEVRPGDKVNTNYLFYFAEPFLSLLSFPVTMDTAVENVKIFVPFIRLAALTYRKQVIAMNEFEKMRKDCTSIVYRFLLSMCGNEDLAEELTSETFYQAYLHIDKFRGECKPETWLCQIAKNALYKETKRIKRITPWEQFRASETDSGDILEKLSNKEQALKIHRHLHHLSEPYKEVFMLRVLGELKFQEIADLFGKSESWAKVTFYRAKDKLIELMEAEK